RRQSHRRSPHLLPRLFPHALSRVEILSQVTSHPCLQDLAAPVHLLTKYLLALVQSPSHVDVLRSSSRKHEDHRSPFSFLIRRQASLRFFPPHQPRRLLLISTPPYPPMAHPLSPHLQRVGHIRQLFLYFFSQMPRQITARRLQRRRAPGRERYQLVL